MSYVLSSDNLNSLNGSVSHTVLHDGKTGLYAAYALTVHIVVFLANNLDAVLCCCVTDGGRSLLALVEQAEVVYLEPSCTIDGTITKCVSVNIYTIYIGNSLALYEFLTI